jgi:hypothetical protein
MSFPQTEIDPRLTIRADLVAAGQRRTAVRRRRRGAALAAIAVVGLAGTAGAAAKIEGSSTGVPVLDEVLAISAERNPPAPSTDRDGEVVGPPPFDVRPAPGGASPPVELPWGPNGSEGAGIGVAYVNRSDHLCFVLVGPDRRPDRSGGVGCTAAHIIDDWLRTAPAVVATGGGAGRNMSSVKGFARADVVALRYESPDGPVEAILGEPWKPDAAEAPRLRAFVALFELDAQALGSREAMRAVMEGDLTATLADGRVVEIPRGR